MINAEGRILHVRQAVEPFGDSKPDWWILSKIAERLGKAKPKYANLSFVQQELKKQVKGISDSRKKVEFERISYPTGSGNKAGTYRILLHEKEMQGSYRGIALADVVEGMKVLLHRGGNRSV